MKFPVFKTNAILNSRQFDRAAKIRKARQYIRLYPGAECITVVEVNK